MMNKMILLLSLLLFSTLHADELIMIRTHQQFPEAMSSLQEAISEHGYTVSRVQRVDVGLTKMGYKTDKYRVVFYGKHEEYEELIKAHPRLIAYLPLNVSVFAEGNDTIFVAMNPQILKEDIPGSNLSIYFDRWESDIYSIFNAIKRVEE